MLKFFAKGFSHGKGYLCTAVGLPDGFKIDVAAVEHQLFRRREGVGRSPRMSIENDKITFLSGLDGEGCTNGRPLKFFIANADDTLAEKPPVTALRSGHADLVGCEKYGLDDARLVCELSSARRTVAYTAYGAICRQMLEKENIFFDSRVTQIGGAKTDECDDFVSRCAAEIRSARDDGDSLGGKVKVFCRGLKIGLGNMIDYEGRFDGIIAHALMGIPSVKSVEIGLGSSYADKRNGAVADKLIVNAGKIIYDTNNCGGIVGGLTTGNDIEVTLTVKPVPTTRQGVETIDSITKEKTISHYERSDVCVVSNVGVIAENVLAATVLDVFLKNKNASVRYEKFDKNNIKGNKVFVVDASVLPLIDVSGEKVFAINDAEKEKNLFTVEKLLKFFNDNGLNRTDSVVAVGGGALLDTVGFAAAVFKRGIGVCFVPTTLLSMTDAAHGGKNAVNFDGIKNVAGTFYLPKTVIVDFDFLNGDYERLKREGFGEIVKCALLDNRVMTEIKASADLKKLVRLCVEFKNEVVERDPTDLFWRNQLNLGHTFGHAFERVFGLSHGEAVLQGLYYETMLATFIGETDGDFSKKTLDFLSDYVVPKRVTPTDVDRILALCAADKKNENQEITFVFAAPYFDFNPKSVDLFTLKEFFCQCPILMRKKL